MMGSRAIIRKFSKRKSAHEVDINDDGYSETIEATAPGMGIVELPSLPQISGISSIGEYPSEAIDVQGAGRIIVKTLYSDSSSNEPGKDFRFKLYDYNGNLMGYTDKYTINNLGITDENGEYLGDLIVLGNEMGAKSIKAYLTKALVSGTADLYIASI